MPQFSRYLFLFVFVLLTALAYSQDDNRFVRAGLMYTIGTQQAFPFNSPDYNYDVRGYKALVNRQLMHSGAISCEIQVEPGIYIASHRLLNE